MKDWRWKGLPGHFCLPSECLFTLCTDVGDYRIFTVGAMYDENGEIMEVGYNKHYETMVFKIKDGKIVDYCEVDSNYIHLPEGQKVSNQRIDEEAEKMHIAMCNEYANKENKAVDWERIARELFAATRELDSHSTPEAVISMATELQKVHIKYQDNLYKQ